MLLLREVTRNTAATTSWKDLQTLDLTLEERKEGNVLLNDTLNTFYLQLSGRGPMCYYSEKEMFYLTTHSTHFIYG